MAGYPRAVAARVGLPILVLLSVPASGQDLAAGAIATVAGDSTNGYDGDGPEHASVRRQSARGVEPGALLDLPWGIAVHGADLYIAEQGNHRVRRVDRERWVIYTHAGNGTGGYGGDGELATNASVNGPSGIDVDAAGNVYIADRGNNVVRVVSPAGLIRTLAGGASAGYGGDQGIATQAALRQPEDVAVDAAGNLYISDSRNYRIRRVDASGIITTIAGNGEWKYDGDDKPALEAAMAPAGVALDGAGGLVVADTRNHRVRSIDLETGLITTLAGTGRRGFSGDGDLAQGAQLSSPWGVAVSPLGDLFITDSGNSRVRRVNMTTGVIETVAGDGVAGFAGDGGPAVAASLWSPYGIDVGDGERIYVADYLNHRIRRINLKKDRIPEYVPPPKGGTPAWMKGAFAVLLSAVGYGVYDYLQPEPDLPGPPDFEETQR